MTKAVYIQQAQEAATLLAKLNDLVTSMSKIYLLRKYYAGGDNEITQEDIPAGVEITAAEFMEFFTLSDNFPKFMAGDDTATISNYLLTCNKLRTDL